MFIETLVGEKQSSTQAFFFFCKPFGHFIHSLNKYLLSTHVRIQGRFPGITELKRNSEWRYLESRTHEMLTLVRAITVHRCWGVGRKCK